MVAEVLSDGGSSTWRRAALCVTGDSLRCRLHGRRKSSTTAGAGEFHRYAGTSTIARFSRLNQGLNCPASGPALSQHLAIPGANRHFCATERQQADYEINRAPHILSRHYRPARAVSRGLPTGYFVQLARASRPPDILNSRYRSTARTEDRASASQTSRAMAADDERITTMKKRKVSGILFRAPYERGRAGARQRSAVPSAPVSRRNLASLHSLASVISIRA